MCCEEDVLGNLIVWVLCLSHSCCDCESLVMSVGDNSFQCIMRAFE